MLSENKTNLAVFHRTTALMLGYVKPRGYLVERLGVDFGT